MGPEKRIITNTFISSLNLMGSLTLCVGDRGSGKYAVYDQAISIIEESIGSKQSGEIIVFRNRNATENSSAQCKCY